MIRADWRRQKIIQRLQKQFRYSRFMKIKRKQIFDDKLQTMIKQNVKLVAFNFSEFYISVYLPSLNIKSLGYRL